MSPPAVQDSPPTTAPTTEEDKPDRRSRPPTTVYAAWLGTVPEGPLTVLGMVLVEPEHDEPAPHTAGMYPVSPPADGCDLLCVVLQRERRPDGTWLSWYDGTTTTDPNLLTVNHFVSTAEAHRSGAWRWTDAQRTGYAQDLHRRETINVARADIHVRKRGRDPGGWRPPSADAWCRYATEWLTVKITWRLSADPSEMVALAEMLNTC